MEDNFKSMKKSDLSRISESKKSYNYGNDEISGISENQSYKSCSSFDYLNEYKKKLGETNPYEFTNTEQNTNFIDEFKKTGGLHNDFIHDFEKNWKKVKIMNGIIDRKTKMPNHNINPNDENESDGNKSMLTCNNTVANLSVILNDSLLRDEDNEFGTDIKNLVRIENQIISKNQVRDVKTIVEENLKQLKKNKPEIYDKEFQDKKYQDIQKKYDDDEYDFSDDVSEIDNESEVESVEAPDENLLEKEVPQANNEPAQNEQQNIENNNPPDAVNKTSDGETDRIVNVILEKNQSNAILEKNQSNAILNQNTNLPTNKSQFIPQNNEITNTTPETKSIQLNDQTKPVQLNPVPNNVPEPKPEQPNNEVNIIVPETKNDPNDELMILKMKAQTNRGRGFNSIAKIRERSLSKNNAVANNSAVVNNNPEIAENKNSVNIETPVKNPQIKVSQKVSEKKIALFAVDKEEEKKIKKQNDRQEKIKLKKQKRFDEENKKVAEEQAKMKKFEDNIKQMKKEQEMMNIEREKVAMYQEDIHSIAIENQIHRAKFDQRLYSLPTRFKLKKLQDQPIPQIQNIQFDNLSKKDIPEFIFEEITPENVQKIIKDDKSDVEDLKACFTAMSFNSKVVKKAKSVKNTLKPINSVTDLKSISTKSNVAYNQKTNKPNLFNLMLNNPNTEVKANKPTEVTVRKRDIKLEAGKKASKNFFDEISELIKRENLIVKAKELMIENFNYFKNRKKGFQEKVCFARFWNANKLIKKVDQSGENFDMDIESTTNKKELSSDEQLKLELRLEEGISGIESILNTYYESDSVDKELLSCLSQSMNNLEVIFNSSPENQLNETTKLRLREIVQLDQSKNKLTDINGLEHFTNLIELNLESNNIKTLNLSSNVILNLSHLETFRLSFNQLSCLPTYFSRNFPRIKRLYVSANNLTSQRFLEEDPFIFLEELDLSRNKINNLTKGINKNILLRKLVLYGNEITNVEELCQPLLEELNQSDNKIKSLDCHLKLPNLKDFSLRNNNLEIIDFEKKTIILQELVTLNLSFNHLLYENVINFCRNLPKLQSIEIIEEDKIYQNNFGGGYEARGNSEHNTNSNQTNRVNNDQFELLDKLRSKCPNLTKFNDNIIECATNTNQKSNFIAEGFYKTLEDKLSVIKNVDFQYIINLLKNVEKLNGGSLIKKSPEYCQKFLKTQQSKIFRKLLTYPIYLLEYLNHNATTSIETNTKNVPFNLVELLSDKLHLESINIRRHQLLKYHLKKYVRAKKERRRHFIKNIKKLIKIQSVFRGHLLRKKYNFYGDPLLSMKRHLKKIIYIQKIYRGYRVRKRYQEFTKGLKVGGDTEFDSDEENFDMDFDFNEYDRFKKKLNIPENVMDMLTGGPSKMKPESTVFAKKNSSKDPKFKSDNSLKHKKMNTIMEEKDPNLMMMESAHSQLSRNNSFRFDTQNISVIKKKQKNTLEDNDIDGISVNSHISNIKMNVSQQKSNQNNTFLSRNDSTMSEINLETEKGKNVMQNDSSNFTAENNSRMISSALRGINYSKRLVLKESGRPKVDTNDQEIIDEWGFKNDAVKEAFQHRLLKDKRRKQVKKKMTAAERYEIFKKKKN